MRQRWIDCQFLQNTGSIRKFQDLSRHGLTQGVFSTRLNAIEGQPPRSRHQSVSQGHAESLRESLQFDTEATFAEASRTIELARRLESFSVGMSYPFVYTACNKPGGLTLAVDRGHAASKTDIAFGIFWSLQIACEYSATTVGHNDMESRIHAIPGGTKNFQAFLAFRITQLALGGAFLVSIAERRKNDFFPARYAGLFDFTLNQASGSPDKSVWETACERFAATFFRTLKDRMRVCN